MNDTDDTPGTGDSHDGGQQRNGNGRWARSLEGAEKDAYAVRLRSRGMTLDQRPGAVTAARGHAWRERHCPRCDTTDTEMD